MPRLVRHDARGPYVLQRADLAKTVAICACGLSAKKPFCDGSHAKTRDEAEEVLYRYAGDDGQGERSTIDSALRDRRA